MSEEGRESLYDHATLLSVPGPYTAVDLCVSRLASPGPERRILLLHGNPGDLDDWRAMAGHLNAWGELAAFDLPGFGRSGDIEAEGLLLDALADRVIGLVDRLSWEAPFTIFGHSHGGGLAQVIAARYPERVEGLVLIATLGFPAHWSNHLLRLPGMEALMRAVGSLTRVEALDGALRLAFAANMSPIFAPEGIPQGLVEREMEVFRRRPEILVNMVRLSAGRPCRQLARDVDAIRAPTLFFHGESDALVPLSCAHNVYKGLAEGTRSGFVKLDRAGHMLPYFHAERMCGEAAAWFG